MAEAKIREEQVMEIQHLANTVTGEQVAEAMSRDGAVIVDNLLSMAQVDEVLAELRPGSIRPSRAPTASMGAIPAAPEH